MYACLERPTSAAALSSIKPHAQSRLPLLPLAKRRALLWHYFMDVNFPPTMAATYFPFSRNCLTALTFLASFAQLELVLGFCSRALREVMSISG
jgi:hypothetical protein